jgi:hypothetical protein
MKGIAISYFRARTQVCSLSCDHHDPSAADSAASRRILTPQKPFGINPASGDHDRISVITTDGSGPFLKSAKLNIYGISAVSLPVAFGCDRQRQVIGGTGFFLADLLLSTANTQFERFTFHFDGVDCDNAR